MRPPLVQGGCLHTEVGKAPSHLVRAHPHTAGHASRNLQRLQSLLPPLTPPLHGLNVSLKHAGMGPAWSKQRLPISPWVSPNSRAYIAAALQRPVRVCSTVNLKQERQATEPHASEQAREAGWEGWPGLATDHYDHHGPRQSKSVQLASIPLA